MHRLLGDLSAAAGEGQEEMGLEQRTLPIHRHHRLPPVHSYFLFGSETNGQQKGSPIGRCWASSGPTKDCREHGKGANTCLGGTFLGNQPIRDEGVTRSMEWRARSEDPGGAGKRIPVQADVKGWSHRKGEQRAWLKG